VHALVPKDVFENPLGETTPVQAAGLGAPDLALSNRTVHWGYFSKDLEPILTVTSGATVVVEMVCDTHTLTQSHTHTRTSHVHNRTYTHTHTHTHIHTRTHIQIDTHINTHTHTHAS
jgi:hypothetical protein